MGKKKNPQEEEVPTGGDFVDVLKQQLSVNQYLETLRPNKLAETRVSDQRSRWTLEIGTLQKSAWGSVTLPV